MSDRTSAGIYGGMFELLASDPSDQHKKWARKLWKSSFEHDFNPCQMEADKALQKLGLAKQVVNEYGDDDFVYRNSDGRDWDV